MKEDLKQKAHEELEEIEYGTELDVIDLYEFDKMKH
jgi:hypothetical protein